MECQALGVPRCYVRSLHLLHTPPATVRCSASPAPQILEEASTSGLKLRQGHWAGILQYSVFVEPYAACIIYQPVTKGERSIEDRRGTIPSCLLRPWPSLGQAVVSSHQVFLGSGCRVGSEVGCLSQAPAMHKWKAV